LKIQFLGATQQVTGSRYFLEAGDLRMLIDCGMFQERPYLGRNWETSPIDPASLDYVILTHAHLDHCGLIPKLVREGFEGPILATPSTGELAQVVLKDSGKIQEEDARYKRKRHEREGRRGPYPEEPLYTVDDAEKTFPQFRRISYNNPVDLSGKVKVTCHDAGHILGSSIVEIVFRENGKEKTILFSGDIGQWDKPIINDPTLFDRADYVVMESTYGDRDHENHQNIPDRLAEIINDTVHRGGNLVIPTFAIERAQELMYYLGQLVREKRIPRLMIFLDSPMAVNVTDIFKRYRQLMDEEALALIEQGETLFGFPGMQLVRSIGQSKAINHIKGSCIIMAGSGMCTGGRIKHHLVHNISDTDSTILFVGYQARHTLGREILEGRRNVRIHGQARAIRARIEQIHGFSAHADRSTLLKWISHLKSPPEQIFLTHGETESAESLAGEIRRQTGWPVMIPEYRQEWVSE
jgi:metallo-beta-lactamase family protein